MTDNEIIKALECCIEMQCTKCPMNYDDCEERDFDSLVKRAIQVFNRQQAEIENYSHNIKNLTAENMQLQAEIERLYNTRVTEHSVQKQLSKAKAEAIKEFAERLCKGRVSNDPVVIAVKTELKEMVGEDETT